MQERHYGGGRISSASEAVESMLQCKRSFLVVCFEDYPAAVSRSEAGDGRSDGEDEMGSVTKEGKSKEFRNSGNSASSGRRYG